MFFQEGQAVATREEILAHTREVCPGRPNAQGLAAPDGRACNFEP